MFCDDGATCMSYHEIYDSNCGGNILLDSGAAGRPDHRALRSPDQCRRARRRLQSAGCGRADRQGIGAADVYSFVNAIFWGNAPGLDFVATCDTGCGKIRVNVSYSMVQTQYRDPGREDHVRRRHRGAGRSAVRRSGEGRLPSEVDGGALDADRLREGLRQRARCSPRATRKARPTRIPSAPASATSSAPTATAARRRTSAEGAGGVLLK